MYKVRLCTIDAGLVSAWKNEFKKYPEVDIIEGDILLQKADAIVSPGNSFGLMDAGLDKIINDYFSFDLERKLQNKIKDEYYGELPVGNAAIIETNDERFPYFISAPTMRVPMHLKDSVNVYLATRAVFTSILDHNKISDDIKSVIIPGMGVGSGRMSYDIAAKQMCKAYESILQRKNDFPNDWKEAVQSHKDLKN